MHFHAEIIARNEDGILERILRVCRHRGFGIHQFRAVIEQAPKLIHIEIEGESSRPLQLLSTQIEKFYDVVGVSIAAVQRDTQVLAVDDDVRIRRKHVRSTVYASISNG